MASPDFVGRGHPIIFKIQLFSASLKMRFLPQYAATQEFLSQESPWAEGHSQSAGMFPATTGAFRLE